MEKLALGAITAMAANRHCLPTRPPFACTMHLKRNRRSCDEATHELVRWILTEGRIEAVGEDPARNTGSPARFIDRLCRRVVSAGVPLWHVTVYTATLHPQVRGLGWRWWRDGQTVEEVKIPQGAELTTEYLQSPMRRPAEHGIAMRQRLERALSEYPLLEELRGEGCTD